MPSLATPVGGEGVYWSFDWSWGLPLLVLTVIFHVCTFVLMVKALVLKVPPGKGVRTLGHFIVAIALTALGAALLHGLEAAAWAILYIWVGALPDAHAAMLYSLSAITSYGHSNIFLEDRWM